MAAPLSSNIQEPTFPRTPIPSAPASSPITKLQIALNNFVGQLCEACYVVTEMAPPIPMDQKPDEQKLDLMNREILQRSSVLIRIIKSIETTAQELPDSSLTQEYYDQCITELQRQNADAADELRQITLKADKLNSALKSEILRLGEELAGE